MGPIHYFLQHSRVSNPSDATMCKMHVQYICCYAGSRSGPQCLHMYEASSSHVGTMQLRAQLLQSISGYKLQLRLLLRRITSLACTAENCQSRSNSMHHANCVKHSVHLGIKKGRQSNWISKHRLLMQSHAPIGPSTSCSHFQPSNTYIP